MNTYNINKVKATVVYLLLSVTMIAQRHEKIMVDYPDRTMMSDSIILTDIDSLVFGTSYASGYKGASLSFISTYKTDATYVLDGKYQRAIAIPNQYANVDFYSESSKFCFQRSQESEHFICFWEKGLTKSGTGNITLNGSTVNISNLLANAERVWDVYVNQLGFLTPGSSTTDHAKILMFIVNQTSWRADGSGEPGKIGYMSGNTKKTKDWQIGLFHCNPQAATARGGHTPAHEIGHTFQYLTGADNAYNKRYGNQGFNYVLGENSKGNEWWEDCANWQAYKVYPEKQFTDGEYFEQYMNTHHMNIHHEAARYNNCFYQDWWCQKHGMNTIGRIWRESKGTEDPVQAYMRLFSLDQSSFADEQMEGYMRFTSIDIDGVRDYSKVKIGAEQNRLTDVPENIRTNYLNGEKKWWIVDSAYCVQNYGYNANPLKVPAAGTVVKATFKGLAGIPGYRNIHIERAGWRYGIAAYCKDGRRVYSEIKSDKEGEVSLEVPEGCSNMWFVVMGAPTNYWTHSWDEKDENDEQWPYAARFEGTDPLGAKHIYGAFPDDYERHDTTVVFNATLAYDASNYSYIRVQYDMNAISEALGLSTAQLATIKRNDTSSNIGDIRFAGVNANGTTMNFSTTTTSSDNIRYGHWFNVLGNVCNYDSSAKIYAEMYPENFICHIGQYPGRLTKGKTYVIRQAVVYTHTNGKQYKAIMEVHLEII